MSKSKQELLHKIIQQLRWDEKVDEDVNVILQDGVVRLSGSVASYGALQAAEADALDVAGISRVDNQLVVRNRQEVNVPTDEDMESFVSRMFCFNDRLADEAITVIVEKSVCTLDGHVDTLWKRFLAEELTYSVWGIKQVVNELSIVPTKRMEDQNIANTLVAALERHHMTDQDKIIVKVEDSHVSLRGKLDSRYAREAAFEMAYSTAGVREVVNEIETAKHKEQTIYPP